jgi:hypothetical protein
METVKKEIENQLKSLFSEILEFHWGFEVPYRDIKKHEIKIVPKDEKYTYTVRAGICPSGKLFIEMYVGVMSQTYIFEGYFESIKDFSFDFEEVEVVDEEGENAWQEFLTFSVCGECIFRMEL